MSLHKRLLDLAEGWDNLSGMYFRDAQLGKHRAEDASRGCVYEICARELRKVLEQGSFTQLAKNYRDEARLYRRDEQFGKISSEQALAGAKAAMLERCAEDLETCVVAKVPYE